MAGTQQSHLATMVSPQEAEEIVRRLTRKYGFLNEKMMDEIGQFNSEYRREIDENWLAMESAVSHSVKMRAPKPNLWPHGTN